MVEETGKTDGSANDSTDSVEAEESFAELFEKESKIPGRLDPGQKVKGRVVRVSGEWVYIDLGGKSEGVVDLSEFANGEEGPRVREGEEIELFFVGVQSGLRKLTTKTKGYSTIDLASLRNAYEAGVPVTGKVKSELKGGYEVNAGGARCFCPFSQMDIRGSRDSSTYVGETFSFKILEYREEGRNIILSRRALLEEERQAAREKLKETLSPGMEVTGKVRSMQKFGVFVDLGVIDGMIPLSELAWGRTEKAEDLLSVGQEVTVRIIGIDWEKNRISLSLKALQPDPWEAVAEKYLPDSQVGGTVVRLAPFGAFVNLEPGIDGLVHISNLGAGRRVNHPKEVLEVGQWVDAYVLSVDPAARKISLSLEPKTAQVEIVLPSVGDMMKGVVEKVMPYGIFVKLESGITGLLPNSEVGTPKGTNHSRMFPPGAEMEVVVTTVDEVKKKISLSRNAVSEKIEHEEFDRYKTSVAKAEKASALGSFGELLKASLKENK
jgi:small subunit ribosomal protein S1